MQVVGRFEVDRDDVRAGLGEAFDVFFRIDDHQVRVEHLFRSFADRRHQRKSERNVRHEYAVHYVDVHPFRFAAVEHRDVVGQMSEVRREHRRGYDSFHVF